MKKIMLFNCTIIVAALVAIEVLLRTAFVQSDSFNCTLSSRAWFKKYWTPLNALGYRDGEYARQDIKGKKIVFIVGDSFVAGQGIRDYQDRFSNILQHKLGGAWQVFNLAQCGWATEEEYQALVSHPCTPDVIVFSYQCNDIESAAHKVLPQPKTWIGLPSNKALAFLFNHSYAFNLIYYRLYWKLGQNKDIYYNTLRQWFADSKVWEEHQREFSKIAEFARTRKAKLIVLFFSYYGPYDLRGQVLTFWQEQGINVVDLGEILSIKKVTPSFAVSLLDAHPNEKVHRKIADILEAYIH